MEIKGVRGVVNFKLYLSQCDNYSKVNLEFALPRYENQNENKSFWRNSP